MWDLTGLRVKGMYLSEFPMTGTVTESRIGGRGKVLHYVIIDEAIKMPWRNLDATEVVVLNETQIEPIVS